MSGVTRRRVISTEEDDVHSGWRRVYAYLRRPGAASAVKRRTNRRERREGVHECREHLTKRLTRKS